MVTKAAQIAKSNKRIAIKRILPNEETLPPIRGEMKSNIIIIMCQDSAYKIAHREINELHSIDGLAAQRFHFYGT